MYHGANNVKNAKYRVTKQHAAKMQKLLRAGKEVIEPSKKATIPVNAAIVMDGPACFIPLTNLSSGPRSNGV